MPERSASSNLYRDYFELSPHLCCAIAPDGTLQDFNLACSQTLERNRAELQAIPWWHWMHAEDRQNAQQAMSRCCSGERVEIVTRIHPPSTATIRWVSWQLIATPEGLILAWGQDITAQKQTEDELNRLFNLPVDLICIAGLDGYFKRLNSSWLPTLGYTESDLLAQPFLNFVHPEDRESTLEAVAQLAEGEKVIDFENRYLCKDGTYKWLAWRTTPLPSEQLLYAVARDITSFKGAIAKREAAEAALQESKAELEWRVSERTQALQHSEAQHCKLARRESLLNRLTRAIRNSLDLDTILQTAVEEIRSLLQISSCTFIWYHPGEAEHLAYWDVVKEARTPDTTSLLGRYDALAIGSLTQQLTAKQIVRVDAVQEVSDRTQHHFFNSLGFASVLALPIETHSGAIGVVCCTHNQQNRPWDEDEVELLQMVRDTLAIAINQAELYLQTLEASKQAQAQTQQLAQTLHELQQTQTQLIQSEKMSSLGQLVAGVAHEINNPVNFIYGNLIHASEYIEDLLRLVKLYEKHEPTAPPEIEAYQQEIDLDFLLEDLPKLLDSMRLGTTRIREIVLSLRNFSRLDEAEMKGVDLHQGIESTLMILQHRLKPKGAYPGIEIIKSYGDLPLVECYPGQLNQVFMNILANAIDALEERYTQSHYVPTLWIQTAIDESQQAIVSIRDNGPGIAPEVQQCLFDPFFTTKSIGAGTGLGLSISYQIIVEKHGGQLQCLSQPGRGAEFRVAIPLRPQSAIREALPTRIAGSASPVATAS
ncbi:PAS domain S-box protein [Oscillatoria amoena NRMC-F 0135]|nr:PAS domain S-box protein [Geitlerinema splendidum]MDL5048361.1 PAS domain S-box protein [Oscillatoria amoena NRMC-F 0135]